MNENECHFTHLIKDTLISNEVRDELTSSASDNEHAPESPISLQVKSRM